MLKKPEVKLLFLIRSDRLSLLEEFSSKLPQILTHRYQLKPLTAEKAEQAIALPAQLLNGGSTVFNSRPYEYSLESLRVLLDTLRPEKEDLDEIESSQLQIVCQELEKVAEAKWKATGKDVTIEPADFKGEEGIRQIINEFYWNQLEKLKQNQQLQLSDDDVNIVRGLIENELLSGNKRIIQSAARVRQVFAEVKPGVTRIGKKDKETFLIDELLDLRLIREEESHLGKVYEISHDTLVESIVKAGDDRRHKEQDKKLKEQQEELELERERTAKEMELRETAQQSEKLALAAKEEAEEAK